VSSCSTTGPFATRNPKVGRFERGARERVHPRASQRAEHATSLDFEADTPSLGWAGVPLQFHAPLGNTSTSVGPGRLISHT
jgi:hypothetical protein